jgi:hypothetical protein
MCACFAVGVVVMLFGLRWDLVPLAVLGNVLAAGVGIAYLVRAGQ